MTDTPRDYRDTVFLPKTDFPMKAGLPQKEPGILAKWQAGDIYAQLRASRKGRQKFILHDGPPYANGDMHIGHALNHILKDMVCRTQNLLGKDAPYVPGWDCHGLPIEWKVEEQYRKKKLDKDQVPVEEFRAECRAYAQHWVDTQREQLKRLGINGDWDNPYLTMDPEAEGTIVAELMKFAESGQLYRGAKPVMWSPVEKTALAEAEVEYEDITSTQIDVAFEIVDSPIAELVGAHAVIWTTTPWTIPVNQALAYGPDIEYSLVGFGFTENIIPSMSVPGPMLDHPALNGLVSRVFLVATSLIPQLQNRITRLAQSIFPDRNPSAQVKTAPNLWRGNGSDLAGTIVRHPMHHLGGFFAKPRPMLPGDFVTTDSGTGLVHMSPDHGEDDFDLCKANGLDPVFAVEGDGKYRADWGWLGGQGSVINPKFNAPDGPICSGLRETGALLAASADYKHSYPHSWRSKAKVIYRCTPQWFVPMDRDLPSPLQGRGTGAQRQGEGDATLTPPLPDDATRRLSLSPEGARGEDTLRSTALAEIARVRFVPEKGRNRIGSMVEGRPDWVLSRQRAWGVPITLFVDRKTGQYLCDPAVNARIVAAVTAGGVDAWSDARAQEYLGDQYRAHDYERVTDILDVWFDSGCTHAFVLESGRWPDLQWPADLYLEGSDQHRGWFQSSLLQSCATRGRAPYDAVLTHGFTMDQKGMKMSKSLGNTIDPLKVMETNGADIIRLWALSVDFTEDHRIGDEILKGVADQYRKLRNTFRYLLGALEGFDESERVAVADMPELERYMLHLLASLDAKLRQAVDNYDYNSYVRALTDFCNEDLSAFFFDIRKDSLYCDALTALKRRAYRTVLDTLFHALVRYAAPVLVFTAEEVWGTRFPDGGSVHLLEWPELPDLHQPALDAGQGFSPDAVVHEGSPAPHQERGNELVERWNTVRYVRSVVSVAIEPKRQEKELGTSLEAEVTLRLPPLMENISSVDLAEIAIVSDLKVSFDWLETVDMVSGGGRLPFDSNQQQALKMVEQISEDGSRATIATWKVEVTKTTHHKCGRCWRHLPEVSEDGALCGRCEAVVDV
jgi:isoleucyl-tRNA synthetase